LIAPCRRRTSSVRSTGRASTVHPDADFLDAIRNPDHEQHEEMLEWAGGRFDPDVFDPATVTKRMKKGLPDWRRMG
jgi:hypothetical protein